MAADGVVLGPALLLSSLPTVSGSTVLEAGQRVRAGALLAELSVLGAAPWQLRSAVARTFDGSRGLTVAMRDGLLVYFGDASRPHAKWLSLERVLADQSSADATYIDVRLPERPAAGFPPAAAGRSHRGRLDGLGGRERAGEPGIDRGGARRGARSGPAARAEQQLVGPGGGRRQRARARHRNPRRAGHARQTAGAPATNGEAQAGAQAAPTVQAACNGRGSAGGRRGRSAERLTSVTAPARRGAPAADRSGAQKCPEPQLEDDA